MELWDVTLVAEAVGLQPLVRFDFAAHGSLFTLKVFGVYEVLRMCETGSDLGFVTEFGLPLSWRIDFRGC